MQHRYEYDAVVVGAGPNGLAAAIRIAQHGFSTLVLEGSDKVGGGCRTEELTLKGFWHDVGSAVHPLALASPFFSSLPLEKYGLKWIQPEVPLAHPVSAGTVAVLQRSLRKTAEALGKDALGYGRIFRPIVSRSDSLLKEFLQPIIHMPRHPLTAVRFGVLALLSARQLVRSHFSQETAAARFAPGFYDRVLVRRVTSPAELESKNADLIGELSPVGLMIYGKWSLDRH